MKALDLQPHAIICFSVFGTPDETLVLVFDILLYEMYSHELDSSCARTGYFVPHLAGVLVHNTSLAVCLFVFFP